MSDYQEERRKLLKGIAVLGGSLMHPFKSLGQSINVPEDPSKTPGNLVSELGTRSRFEQPKRYLHSNELSSWSYTPLQQLKGIITPSDLHFERHHGGIPEINSILKNNFHPKT